MWNPDEKFAGKLGRQAVATFGCYNVDPAKYGRRGVVGVTLQRGNDPVGLDLKLFGFGALLGKGQTGPGGAGSCGEAHSPSWWELEAKPDITLAAGEFVGDASDVIVPAMVSGAAAVALVAGERVPVQGQAEHVEPRSQVGRRCRGSNDSHEPQS